MHRTLYPAVGLWSRLHGPACCLCLRPCERATGPDARPGLAPAAPSLKRHPPSLLRHTPHCSSTQIHPTAHFLPSSLLPLAGHWPSTRGWPPAAGHYLQRRLSRAYTQKRQLSVGGGRRDAPAAGVQDGADLPQACGAGKECWRARTCFRGAHSMGGDETGNHGCAVDRTAMWGGRWKELAQGDPQSV